MNNRHMVRRAGGEWETSGHFEFSLVQRVNVGIPFVIFKRIKTLHRTTWPSGYAWFGMYVLIFFLLEFANLFCVVSFNSCLGQKVGESAGAKPCCFPSCCVVFDTCVMLCVIVCILFS
jgi:hypothetical protein